MQWKLSPKILLKHPPLEAETREEKGEQDRKLIKGRRMNDSWVHVFWVGCQTAARDHTKVFRYDMVCVMKDIPVWSYFFFCCQASLRRECAWSEFVLLSATIVLVASRQVQTSGQRRDYCTEQTMTSSHTHTHTNRMEILHSRQHLEDISVTRHHYAFPSLASFITRATCLSLSKKRREAGGKPERREEQQRGEASHVERITDRDAKWRKTRATSSVLQYKFNVVVLYCRILTWWHLTLLFDNTSSHFFLCSENHATPNLVIFISIH